MMMKKRTHFNSSSELKSTLNNHFNLFNLFDLAPKNSPLSFSFNHNAPDHHGKILRV